MSDPSHLSHVEFLQRMFEDGPRPCPAKGCRSHLGFNDNRICQQCMIKFGIMPGTKINDNRFQAIVSGRVGPADHKFRIASQVAHKARQSVVYFIQMREDGPIKIGKTANSVEWRLSELQTGNPYKLRVLSTLRADVILEQQLHSYFDEYRMEGEWFQPHPEVYAMAQLAAANDLEGILDLFEKRLAENG